MARRSILLLACLAVCIGGCSSPEPPSQTVRVQAAIVQLRPLEGRSANGIIDLVPTAGGLAVKGELLGLKGTAYELRAHQLGDCTDPRGRSAGPPYAYSDPVTGRDVNGTVTTFEPNRTGELAISDRFRGGRLSGTLSLRGRSLVLHRIDRDEAGATVATRVACGIVGVAREGTGAS